MTPRVRWVTSVAPTFAGGGGHVRQAHLLRALTRAAEVELVVADDIVDAAVDALAADVIRVPGLSRTPMRRSLRRLDDLRHVAFDRHHKEVVAHRAVRRRVAAALADRPPVDLVCVEPAGMAPLVRTRGAEPWVLTLHNIGSEMARQRAAVAGGRRQAWLARRDVVKAERFERFALDHFDEVIVVSEADAARVGGLTTVVPNGVDTQQFAMAPVPDDPVIVFTGALYTGPNLDGITWFCDEVLPLVRDRVPEARLEIVGLRPVAEVLALASRPGVDVHPDVPSTVPFLHRARVAVAPLRIGTGSRLKVLEAMSSGRPVVGTTIGFEGLEVVDRTHVLVADDPGAFAARVVECLLGDPDMTGVARRLVEERYSWGVIADQYTERMARIIAGT